METLAEAFDVSEPAIDDTARRAAGQVERLAELWNLKQTPEEAIRRTLRDIARRHRIALPAHRQLDRQVNRMRDAAWWRRALRKRFQTVELLQIHRGAVHNHASPCVSDKALKRFHRQRSRNAQMLASMEAVNESTGEVRPLDELVAASQANPSNRRRAMMVRIKGIEAQAKARGHVGLFVTITAPSRMHARQHRSGQANPTHDGTTPRQVQTYLNRVWRRSLRAAAHQGLAPYGLRVVEPHHDACPHWHVLMFTAPADAEALLGVLRSYAMADSPNEPGAAERRFVVEHIDPEKGSALAYVAKYVSKSIDGEGLDGDDEHGGDGRDGAARRVAWARLWGVRQFQFFGVPPITPTRELFRVDAAGLPGAALPAAHAACKANDYAAWLSACEAHGMRFSVLYAARPSTRYRDETTRAIEGLRVHAADLARPVDVITRVDTWRIQPRQPQHATPAAEPPWTRFNNCAGLDFTGLFPPTAAPAREPGGSWSEGARGRGVPPRAPLPGATRAEWRSSRPAA
ncbi:replication endonuclease [Rubrivivax gelatinosus]|uniref:replication endonuclease n=1 Tax=Rubrivivax gelatinosus TaxID=28068 RepID=UPI0014052D60|nr:replication endonuclease [Rubrivivax gelatinosus]